MSFPYASADQWAQDHSLAAEVRLARLEAIAFHRHPDIYAHFGSDGAAMAAYASRPRRSAVRRAGTAVAVVLIVLGVIAPVAAMATLAGDRFDFWRIDAERAVPIAGVLFAVAALTQLTVFVVWLVRGARFDGMVFGVALVAAVAAGLGAFSMPNVSEIDGYTGWEAWYPTVLACLVIAGVSALAMLIRFRVRAPESVPAEPETPSPTAAVATIRAKVAALPYDERQAISADREAALQTLRERDLIDADLLERARVRDLGTLFVLDGESRLSN